MIPQDDTFSLIVFCLVSLHRHIAVSRFLVLPLTGQVSLEVDRSLLIGFSPKEFICILKGIVHYLHSIGVRRPVIRGCKYGIGIYRFLLIFAGSRAEDVRSRWKALHTCFLDQYIWFCSHNTIKTETPFVNI